VISNNAKAFGLDRARQAGIATVVISHKDYPDREQFDQALQRCIDGYQPQLVVLAGFMRILTDAFVNHYLGKMINIHPSLLPKYQGLHTHQRAIDAGETEHGVTVHFVTPELDGGPGIIQAHVPVQAGDSAEVLAQRVLIIEHQIYPTVIEWFATDRLHLQGNKISFDGQTLDTPLQYNT
jgi:phosphoribosylglycinamide formyltransferase 1